MAITVKSHTKEGYKESNTILIGASVRLAAASINPRCIARSFGVVQNDVIAYLPTNCYRLGDNASAKFSLDSEGVPTITNISGAFSHDWGAFECVIKVNGVSKTAYVHHVDDAALLATFSLNLDSNGWTDITPVAGSRLLYVRPSDGNDATATIYVKDSSEPAGGWKTPTSFSAGECYETMAGAYADMRDGFGDVMLLDSSEVHRPTTQILFNGKSGASASQRLIITSFGATGNERAHVNPTTAVTDDIISSFAEEYIGVTDLDIYPTWHNPDHADWAGWGFNTPPGKGIDFYTGGGASGVRDGYLIENCRIRYCGAGIGLSGQAGVTDTIIRRNVVEWNFNETGRAQGFSCGQRLTTPLEYPFWNYYIEGNTFYHNGWYRRAYDIQSTASSGSTTTLTDVGRFTGLSLETVTLRDNTNGGVATIVSNTNDTITFNAAANVDFTGGGSYDVGQGSLVGSVLEDHAQGQALPTNHNFYTRYMKDSLITNNLTLLSSSISHKTTADTTSVNKWQPIDGQDETNYTGGGDNGEFAGGTGWIAGDVGETITLTSGTIITIDAVSLGAVTEFTVDNSGDDGLNASSGTISQSTTTGTGTGFSITLDDNVRENTEELDPLNHPSDNFIQQYEVAVDCELGLGGGGNTDYNNGPRFKDYRCCETLIIDMGNTDQTSRGGGVAVGTGQTDWRNGLCSGNLAMNFVGTNGPIGMGCGGHDFNTVFAVNKTLNTGIDSTAVNTGSFNVDASTPGFSNHYIVKNRFKEEGNCTIIGNFPAAYSAQITMEDNRYDFARADATAAYVDGVLGSFATFLTASGETGSKQTITYANESATIGTYNTSRGGTGTTQAFIDDAVENDKLSWDTTLEAIEVFAYFKEAMEDG